MVRWVELETKTLTSCALCLLCSVPSVPCALCALCAPHKLLENQIC
jgi:hypothetical protein